MMSEQQHDICIISDSWLTPLRMRSCTVKEKNGRITASIRPHMRTNGVSALSVRNLSKGSLALTTVLASNEILSKWVETSPIVTVLHIFACDIVNKRVSLSPKPTKSIGTCYADYVEEALETMMHFAQENMQESQYNKWVTNHKFLIFALPDWKNFEQTRPNSLNVVQYRHIRSKINKVLKKKRIRFLRQHNALLVHPALSNAEMNGVHLNHQSQAVYNTYLMNSVARLDVGNVD